MLLIARRFDDSVTHGGKFAVACVYGLKRSSVNMIRSESHVRLDCVQLLRAVAAVAVVTHHIRLFGNGAWGVDLFFVISGFIMCYVTEDSGRHFFAKRIIRIVPLYWGGTLAVFCVALFFPSLLDHTTADFVDLLKSLFFIPFKKGHNTVPVLFLGWTLNYEMFFYVVFSLSMALNHKRRAVIAIALLTAITVAGQWVPGHPVPLRFFTRPIILEFAFGMICYELFTATAEQRMRNRSGASRLLWTLAGAIFIACMPLATVISPFEEPVLRWGGLAALSFYCILHGLSGVKLPRGIVVVGDASYSLYLFHPYVIQLFTKMSGALSGTGPAAYCMAVLVILLCCVLSVISYEYLERPITEFLRKRFLGGPAPSDAPAGHIHSVAATRCPASEK
jgi:exopolysaccharide production protein ExoZ